MKSFLTLFRPCFLFFHTTHRFAGSPQLPVSLDSVDVPLLPVKLFFHEACLKFKTVIKPGNVGKTRRCRILCVDFHLDGNFSFRVFLFVASLFLSLLFFFEIFSTSSNVILYCLESWKLAAKLKGLWEKLQIFSHTFEFFFFSCLFISPPFFLAACVSCWSYINFFRSLTQP